MLDIRKSWYDRKDVMFEIVKLLYARETSFFGIKGDHPIRVRCIKAHKVSYLEKNFERWDYMKDGLNLYKSITLYRGLPMFAFDLKTKREQQRDFKENAKDYVIGYDFVTDFDAHDNVPLDAAYSEAIFFRNLLDRYKVPYSFIFSNKGFHIEIPSLYLDDLEPDPLRRQELISINMKDFKEMMVLDSMDSGIYGLRQPWRCPYGIDSKTFRVCLPLTKDQQDHFSLDMVNPNNIGPVRDRGLCLIDHGLNLMESRKNTKKFFEEVILNAN